MVRLLYHPTGAREGGDRLTGVRHQASCPDLLHTVPDPYLAWGRGKMGNGERVEEDWGLLGNPSHPWSGVYGAVLGQTGTAYPR